MHKQKCHFFSTLFFSSKSPKQQLEKKHVDQPNRRSIANNKKLYKDKAKNNGKLLEVDLDTCGGFKFVGDNGSNFKRLLSNQIRSVVPLYFKDWDHVPNDFKKLVFPVVYVSIQILISFAKLSSVFTIKCDYYLFHFIGAF